MVLLHGNAVDHRLLLPLDRALSGWERIYVDLPGCGQTPPLAPPGGLPDLVRWVGDTVPTLVDRGPYALLGNSLGGLLARTLVAASPDDVLGLALLCPVVDPVHAHRSVPDPTVLERDDAFLATLDPQDRADYAAMAVRQSPETWRAFRDHALPGIRAADLRAMARLARAYALPSSPENAGFLFTGATTVITGRQDHVVGFEDHEALRPYYPEATFHVLDRAGHNAHLDQPAAVTAHLTDWLARVGSTGKSIDS